MPDWRRSFRRCQSKRSGRASATCSRRLRSPAEETFPSPAIVARFHAKGGTAVTVGSDAHLVDSLAWALQDGYDSAREAGFTELTFRRGGARVPGPMPTAPNVTAGRSL